MINTCALCKKQKEIVKSHLIPKFAYKRLKSNNSENNDPIHISHGSAFATSKQFTKELLCQKCEELFSQYEDYVARLTKYDGSNLKILQHIIRLDTPTSILVELNEKIDTEKLSLFAISMIWRSSVMHRSCRLGRYEEEFRKYLLNEIPFSSNAILTIRILKPSVTLNISPQNFVAEPCSIRENSTWYHKFRICGLDFRCVIGKAISPEQKKICLAGQGSKKYAVVLALDQSTDFMDELDSLIRATPRGRLASNKLVQNMHHH